MELNKEKLEELASNLAIKSVKEYMKIFPSCDNTFDYRRGFEEGFIDGAKCQAEKMYSEKEVRDLFNLYKEEFSIYRNSQILNVQFEEWFNENKKQQ